MSTKRESFFLETDLTVDEAEELDAEMAIAERHLLLALQVARRACRNDVSRYQKKLLDDVRAIRRMTLPIRKAAQNIKKERR